MTSHTETVSRQNLWVDNIAKSTTSKSNSVLLPANDDRRPLFQWSLMNFQLFNKTRAPVPPYRTKKYKDEYYQYYTAMNNKG